MANAYMQYQQNSILTASQEDLTLALYNGALKFCNQCMEALRQKDYARSHNLNLRVQDIINELIITLDYKYPIADQMRSLYLFIKELLISSNVKKEIQQLEEATNLIREFRDVWIEAKQRKQ